MEKVQMSSLSQQQNEKYFLIIGSDNGVQKRL